jgi:hypothetical protein
VIHVQVPATSGPGAPGQDLTAWTASCTKDSSDLRQVQDNKGSQEVSENGKQARRGITPAGSQRVLLATQGHTCRPSLQPSLQRSASTSLWPCSCKQRPALHQ